MDWGASLLYAVLAVTAALLFAAGLFVVVMNWAYVFASYLVRKHHSVVPIVGGVFCAIALAIAPLDGLRLYWPLPLLLDIGCIPIVTLALVAMWRRWRSRATHPTSQIKNQQSSID